MNQRLILFRIVNLIFFVSVCFQLSGCTTPKTPRPPSTYLLNTEKSQSLTMNELKEMLVANKYEVKNLNDQTGFLITKPRRFQVKRADGSKVSTEQNLLIRQEGGSVTVRANYDCEYFNDQKQLVVQPCNNDDVDVNNRIRRIESALLKQIRQKLEEQTSTQLGKDLTVEPDEAPASPAQRKSVDLSQ